MLAPNVSLRHMSVGYKYNTVSRRLFCLCLHEKKMNKLTNKFMNIIFWDILLYVASDATFKLYITNY